MKPIFKVSLYFLIVLVLSIVGPMFVTPVLYKIGLVPPLVLMVIHIIFFIVPAIIKWGRGYYKIEAYCLSKYY